MSFQEHSAHQGPHITKDCRYQRGLCILADMAFLISCVMELYHLPKSDPCDPPSPAPPSHLRTLAQAVSSCFSYAPPGPAQVSPGHPHTDPPPGHAPQPVSHGALHWPQAAALTAPVRDSGPLTWVTSAPCGTFCWGGSECFTPDLSSAPSTEPAAHWGLHPGCLTHLLSSIAPRRGGFVFLPGSQGRLPGRADMPTGL